ncbi:MAG: sensor histidine kinase KdpD [Legionella sp.]|nr:sensor histidine kinase KdpD [Legionella sp.]
MKSRPNPEQLLKRVKDEEQQENRGKLKIYLGAAPGVGKTHEMLHDALEKRNQGFDVVLGIAETHGREDIERLVQHFETLPRQTIVYRDTNCLEFNLDGAIKRHPGLILVDEMAHTNAPGLRHTKRWQDIQELLERGIDVYTTLNVQHIESLKDDVAQIIHTTIHETVPDSMLERADTIELVDLPPEDLLRRLQEGKVYFPQQAELAQEHFFRKGNLTALRELALRATAERVNSDVLWYRQGEGIKEIWPVKDKILVCVGPKPEALKLIRAAKRLAQSLQAEWLAVYIDIPSQSVENGRNRAIKNLSLAELLGAETHVLAGFDIVKETMHFAREQNITQIMIWKHIGSRWRGWFRRNLADEIVRHSDEIDVFLMTGTSTEPPYQRNGLSKSTPWSSYGISIGVVALCTLLNAFLYDLLAPSSLVMVYLLGVTLIALLGKTGVSVLASILSVLAYDFFFIPPFYSFEVADVEYFFTLLVMLIVTQIISHLTILIRYQATSARLTQHQTTAMYTFSRKLTTTRGTNKILELGAQQIANLFNSNTLILLSKNNRLKVQTSVPLGLSLNAKELSIAQWVFDTRLPAGLGTDTLNSSDALYLPLIGSTNVQGVLRVQPQQLFTPEQKEFLASCANQFALALEVDRLHEQARTQELEIAKDRAQTVLLASIFHDLCFPLKRVISVINDLNATKEDKSALIEHNIDNEINKLNRLNNNLYQIIRLETEGVELKKELSSLKKIIDGAIKTAHKTLENRPIELTLPDNLPLMPLDNKLITEVLVHLLDNAIKFSPKKSKIHLAVQITNEKVIISVEDFGSGIIPDEKNKLFKKFYRGKKVLSEHGLGLGLAICEKIITAHNGVIWVENLKPQGAAVRFTLPLNTKESNEN